MTAPSLKSAPALNLPTAPEKLAAVDALVMVAIIALATLLMVRSGSRRGAELMPWPDGLEYAAAAVNIDHGLGPMLHFGGYSYPSRYTEGYPLILAVAWPLVGANPARLYLATVATGLLAIGALYLLVFKMFGRLSAALSAAILALSPIFLTYSTLVLSDVPTLAITLIAALAMVRATEAEYGAPARDVLAQSWAIFGFIAGFTVMIRPTNAVLLVGVVLCVVMVRPAGAGLKLRHMLAAMFAFGLGFALMPAWQAHENIATLGRASANGYAWWVPEVYGAAGRTFRASYLFGPTMPRNPHGNLIVYVLTILGLDGLIGDRGDARFFLYPFAAAAFALVGIVAAVRDETVRRTAKRVLWFGVGFLAMLFAVYSVYLFTDIGFLLPGAFVLFAAAGFGIVTANRFARDTLRSRDRDLRALGGAVGVIVLDLMLAIALSSEVAIRLRPAPAQSAMVPALQSIDRTIPQDATIVSNISLQFLELYLGADKRTFVGLNALDPGERFTDYHLNRLYEKRAAGWTGAVPPVVFNGPETSAESQDSLAAAMRAKTPVFVLLGAPETQNYANLLKDELDQLQAKFVFEPVEQNSSIAMYRLKPRLPARNKH